MKKKTKLRKNKQGKFSEKLNISEKEDSQSTLMEFVISAGLEVLKQEIENEITNICGERYKHLAERICTRWGKTNSGLVLGGKKVSIACNRIRNIKNGTEKKLKTIEKYQNEDPLKNYQLEQMLIGVSTRKLKRSFEDTPEERKAYGYSKSSVSRNFIMKTKQQLAEWLSRPIKIITPILMIDGIVFKKTTLVIAAGIDKAGNKHILGIWEGSTENKRVCIDLINNLIDRGLKQEDIQLAVLDGGKAINAAVKEVFGKELLIQRCQVHKKRNVGDYLPKNMRRSVKDTMSTAYLSKDYKTAKKILNNLKRGLSEKYPGAARSLDEGMEETLTLLRIGVPKELQKSLCTTNIIESINSGIKNITKRVKRWRNPSMVVRWVYSGVVEAQRNFRRINGHQKIDLLYEKLYNYYKENRNDQKNDLMIA